MNIYIVLVSLIIIFIAFMYFRGNLTEHFDTGANPESLTLECMVQCDDSFKAMYNGTEYGTGNNWQTVYRFSIPNVRYGTKVYFYCTNFGGAGWIKGQFKLGGMTYYTDLSNMKPLGKMVEGLPLLGNRYVGCMKDTSNRDLPFYMGEMDRDQCLRVANQNGMAFYAMQNGKECYTGNSYGRYGKANNCNMNCASNPNEKCGGTMTNQVYAVNEPPMGIVVSSAKTSSEFDSRTKALWIESGDDNALGTWVWEFTIPDGNLLEYCPNIDYNEFNPAGCSDPTNEGNCELTALPNYRANSNRCFTKYDWEDPDKFFLTLNRLFQALILNTEAGRKATGESVKVDFRLNNNPQIDSCNCDKNRNGERSSFRVQYKTLIHYSSPKTFGSVEYKTISNTAWAPYLKDFMTNNQNLNKIIVMIGQRMGYPLDDEQMLDTEHVIPDTPMYYALVGVSLKYSNSHKDILADQFKLYYKRVYSLARIITGIPKFVRECSCLALNYPGTRQCVPC